MHRITFGGRVHYTPNLKEDWIVLQEAFKKENFPLVATINKNWATVVNVEDEKAKLYFAFITKKIDYPEIVLDNAYSDLGVSVAMLILRKNGGGNFWFNSSTLNYNQEKKELEIGSEWWNALYFIEKHFGYTFSIKYNNRKKAIEIKLHN